MEKKLIKSIIIAACILITSCTIDYNDQSAEVEKSENIPDSIMTNFELIQIKQNKPYSKINSSLAEIYNKLDKTVLHDVKFTEYDTEMNIIATKGQADKIEYFNDTENATLTGNLIFYSEKDKVEIFGDSLYWNKNDKELNSDSDSSILVIKDDGSKIEGFGFSASLKFSTFSFKNNVTGVTP